MIKINASVFKYLGIALMAIIISSCTQKKEESKTEGPTQEEIMQKENEFKKYAEYLNSKIRNVDTTLNLAYWNYYNNSTEENMKKAEKAEQAYNQVLSNTEDFKKLKEFKESGLIKDHILQRGLKLIYNEYLEKQLDSALLNQMTQLGLEIEGKYNKYRAKVDGKEYTDNEVEETLKTSTDNELLEKVWKSHKDIGPVVEEDIKQLVKLRNKAANKLGFDNYHSMSLELSEQDPEYIEQIFDKIDKLTKDEYTDLKKQIDNKLAKRYGVKPGELMPWHYQNRYFQEAPEIYDVDLDKYYEDVDIVQTAIDYYSSIGMDIKDIVERSDLYERDNKSQHAFCFNINRDAKDIRVLCNIQKNYNWMNTVLHEYGHAVYEKYLDQDLPYILKQPAHIFTTEAIAMLFGRFASNANWMHDMIGIDKEEKKEITETAYKMLKLEQLVFSRWSQVMYRFEKSMYENPDQDLNKLWWDLVEKYQMMDKPEGRDMPDWAAKVHIATAPCYYHNYLLGELLASQLYYKIQSDVMKVQKAQIGGGMPGGTENLAAAEMLSDPEKMSSLSGSKKAGQFLIENVFNPGRKYYWDNMIEKATGEKLNPKYYAEQFVE